MGALIARSRASTAASEDGAGEIRQASILDVPAMVRALTPIPAPDGVSDVEMSRILRLTLTHIAIEHGMAWLETDADGAVTAIALAVPTWELDGGAQLPDVLAREADIDAEPVAAHDEMLGWVDAVGKAWLVAHPVCHGPGQTGPLLRQTVAAAEARAVIDGVPLVLIATRAEDRLAAADLGFESAQAPGAAEGIWLGVKTPAPPVTA